MAIERVEGRLSGREGSFVLQHTGTMAQGKPSLSVTVVPDSGTGALQGLTGEFRISMADGQHSYEFDYELPEPELADAAEPPKDAASASAEAAEPVPTNEAAKQPAEDTAAAPTKVAGGEAAEMPAAPAAPAQAPPT